MSEQNQENSDRELEQVAKETELGAFVVRHKIGVIAFVILLVCSVVGYGIYSKMLNENSLVKSNQIFKFKNETFSKFSEDKMEVAEFMKEFNQLTDQIGNYKGMISLLLDVSDLLKDKDKLEDAATVLESTYKKYGVSNPYSKYFIVSRLAAIYEDSNRFDDAIKLLEELNNISAKIMESKRYLDLGRLYIKAGNKNKALVNLKYLIDNFAQDELSKVAKIYLEDISKTINSKK